MEEVTVKTRIQHAVDSYKEFSEEEVSEAKRFLCETAHDLYYSQCKENPKTNWFMIALEYDGSIEYYRIIKWDWKIKDFIYIENRNIEKRIVDLIIKLSDSQGVIPTTQAEARAAGYIPEIEKRESREERRKREFLEKQRHILLLDLNKKEAEEKLKMKTG